MEASGTEAQKAFRVLSMNTSMAEVGDDSSFEDSHSCSPKYFLFAAGITNEVLVSCINGGIIVYTRLASDTYQVCNKHKKGTCHLTCEQF